VDVPLVGDAQLTLQELLSVTENKTNDTFLEDCRADMKKWLEEQDELELSEENPMHPQALARAIGDLTQSDAIITLDTGAVTVWGARNLRIRNGQLFTLSGGLASMAFALPAAIGAKLMFPSRQVIALCGDGGFAMLMCDFATAVKYRLNIKVVVFNNGKLSLIQMEQESNGNPESETDLHNPDYAEFARSCGGEGYTIRDAAEARDVIRKVLSSASPAVINVFVNPEELTWPPKVTLSEVLNYSKAKLTELFSRK
jgi:pyruvate oxidase